MLVEHTVPTQQESIHETQLGAPNNNSEGGGQNRFLHQKVAQNGRQILWKHYVRVLLPIYKAFTIHRRTATGRPPI